MQATYNTTRYQQATYIAKDGSILSEGIIDTASESDLATLANWRSIAPDRVCVRPASVAEIVGDGTHEVAGRVDAVTVNGELYPKHSAPCRGRCRIEVRYDAGGVMDDEFFAGTMLLPTTHVSITEM